MSASEGYLWGERSNGASPGEHDLAGRPALQHRPEALLGLLHGQLETDLRADPGVGHERQQVGQLVPGTHRGTDHAELQEEQPLQVGAALVIIIGGMAYATLMTLFIIPVMYDILYRRQPKVVDVGDDTIDDVPDDAAEFLAQLETERKSSETEADV